MSSVRVSDLNRTNVDDVFMVCSHAKLSDPIQRRGIELKRQWLLEMLEKHGPLTKLAYLDGRPIAQILFFPEEVAKFLPEPRKYVIVLQCVYNPFPEAQGKGAGTALLRSLMEDCRAGIRCLEGRKCSFIVSNPFQTGEGLSMAKFYEENGFKRAHDEMFLEIAGRYEPKIKLEYEPLPEDRGRAIIFYNRICEWSYPFALQVRDYLLQIKPGLKVELVDEWLRPWESKRRANQWLVVNAVPIKSFWTQREEFRQEVERALGKTS